MSAQKRTVLIAGGSVAGLTLANILEQLGIDYLVLEKYSKIAPDMGASIGIFPNGFRILDQLGCYDSIKDLVKGADAFQTMANRNENGQLVSELMDASKHFIKRYVARPYRQFVTDENSLGYEPIFVDRQMIIQILYDNLRDKSKVLTSKGVVKVSQTIGQVEVSTADGQTFYGDVLVGADGIHSTVRQEMWRLADEDAPGYFPKNERLNVPTEYCCIFGISQATDKFPKYSSQMIQGHDYSYLVATGPNHRIYWFLFKKLPETARGLYEKIPRYTEEQRDALAAEHASDPITETLNFGELYAIRTTSTLQALPEVVFKKWHYNRIMTIGDAAHKFNPIGGQGGNSAIEDAAVLADQLHALLTREDGNTILTDAEIANALQETQRIRFDRANKLMANSHNQQSVQAKDKFFSRIIANYVIPRSNPESLVDSICGDARPAARVKALPMPQRPHSEVWDDEKEPALIDWKRFGYVASFGFAALAVLAARNSRLPLLSLPKLMLSVVSKT